MESLLVILFIWFLFSGSKGDRKSSNTVKRKYEDPYEEAEDYLDGYIDYEDLSFEDELALDDMLEDEEDW